MGNASSNPNRPPPLNSGPSEKVKALSIAPALCVPQMRLVFRMESNGRMEHIYKVGSRYIPISISVPAVPPHDRESKCHITSTGEKLYGYKIKYRYKNADKIKNILFKKRIYGSKEEIIPILAEIKFMGVLQIGPFLGNMLNGTDAYLYPTYLEYYEECLLNLQLNSKKLFNKLQQVLGRVDN